MEKIDMVIAKYLQKNRELVSTFSQRFNLSEINNLADIAESVGKHNNSEMADLILNLEKKDWKCMCGYVIRNILALQEESQMYDYDISDSMKGICYQIKGLSVRDPFILNQDMKNIMNKLKASVCL